MATVQTILERMSRFLSLEYSDVISDAPTLSEFLGYINTAYQTVAKYGMWRWLMTQANVQTVAGQDYVYLPDDFVAWQIGNKPRYSDGIWYYPELVAPDQMTALRAYGSQGTRPTYYQHNYEPNEDLWKMELWPTPQEQLTLVIPYERRLLELVNLDERPKLPGQMHETLIIGCLGEAEEQRDAAATGSQKGKFLSMLARDWAQYGDPQRDAGRLKLRSLDDQRRIAEDWPAAQRLTLINVTGGS
jgi:hypothetical protein